eukprot:273383-Chlamydomonas_euryale.AAC.1
MPAGSRCTRAAPSARCAAAAREAATAAGPEPACTQASVGMRRGDAGRLRRHVACSFAAAADAAAAPTDGADRLRRHGRTAGDVHGDVERA